MACFNSATRSLQFVRSPGGDISPGRDMSLQLVRSPGGDISPGRGISPGRQNI